MTIPSFVIVFAKSDSDKANDFVETLKKEEDIRVLTPFAEFSDDIDNDFFEKNCAPTIEDINFIVIIASNNSRKSTLCSRSIKYALELNKKIIVVRFEKNWFQPWIKNDWNYRDDVYDWSDEDKRAEMIAILREWSGCKLIDGDRIGAKISFYSTSEPMKLLVYNKECLDKPIVERICNLTNQSVKHKLDLSYRLRKGNYLYVYQSLAYPKRARFEQNLVIRTNSNHQQLSFDAVKELSDYIDYVEKQEKRRNSYLLKILKTTSHMTDEYHTINNHLSFLKNKKFNDNKISTTALLLITGIASTLLLLNFYYWDYSSNITRFLYGFIWNLDSIIDQFAITSVILLVFSIITFYLIVWGRKKVFFTIQSFLISYNEWKLEPAIANKNYYDGLYEKIKVFRPFSARYFEQYDGFPESDLNKIINDYKNGMHIYHRNPINALKHLPINGIFQVFVSCAFWILFAILYIILLYPNSPNIFEYVTKQL